MLTDRKIGLGKETVISAINIIEKCLIEGEEDLQATVVTDMVGQFGSLLNDEDLSVYPLAEFFGAGTRNCLKTSGLEPETDTGEVDLMTRDSLKITKIT